MLLRQGCVKAQIGNRVDPLQQHIQQRTKIRCIAVFAQKLQRDQHGKVNARRLHKGKYPQKDIGIDSKNRFQIIEHAMEPVRVNARLKNAVLVHGIDPNVMHHHIRCLIAPYGNDVYAIDIAKRCRQSSQKHQLRQKTHHTFCICALFFSVPCLIPLQQQDLWAHFPLQQRKAEMHPLLCLLFKARFMGAKPPKPKREQRAQNKRYAA